VPQFNTVAEGWLEPLVFPMDDVWHAMGSPESGTNYYTAGGPLDSNTPYWERFNPDSPLYRYDHAHQNLLVRYGSGVSYQMKNGAVKNTPLHVFADILRMLAAITYQ
jgi:hypothetical protein